MPYYVYSPHEDLGDVCHWSTKADAAKHRVDDQKIIYHASSAEVDVWQARERQRMIDNPQLALPDVNDWRPPADHFVHRSTTDPAQVAYTPDAQYGHEDRQVRVTVAEYARRYGHLSAYLTGEVSGRYADDGWHRFWIYRPHSYVWGSSATYGREGFRYCGDYSAAITSAWGPIGDVTWIDDVAGITRAYRANDCDGSCMRYRDLCRVCGECYGGSPDFTLATLWDGDVCTARAVVRVKDGKPVAYSGRIYGSQRASLRAALKAAGVPEKTEWADGGRIPVDCGMPYIDCGDYSANRDGEWWRLTLGDGDIRCNRTDGIEAETEECHVCGDNYDRDNMTTCDRCGHPVCSDCYTYCDDCSRTTCHDCAPTCDECNVHACRCQLEACGACNAEVCENCRGYCNSCEHAVCDDCSRTCDGCSEPGCSECVGHCTSCNDRVCGDCETDGKCEPCAESAADETGETA